MNAYQPTEPNATSRATRAAVVAGTIPPGLILLGFRDGDRLAFRDKAANESTAKEPERSGQPDDAADLRAGRFHAAFAGLLAIGTIALLAFGR